jgi:biotin operon repressor
MNNPTKYLKVPEGLIKKCNEQKLLKEVMFYYMLKSLTIEGRIYKGRVSSSLISKLGIAEGSVWRKIKQLLTKGFLKDEGNYYQLISFDSLWEELGYSMDLKYGKLYRGKETVINRQRKGSFKIFKISTSDISNLYYYICYEDIKLNLQRQSYAVLKHVRDLIKSGKLKLSKAMQKTILKRVKINDIKSFRYLNHLLLSLDESCLKWFKMGISDITLSCKKIADMFGLKTPISGWEIERRLEVMKLLKVKTRKYFVSGDPAVVRNLKKQFWDDPRYVVSKEASKVTLLFFNTNLLTPLV